MAFLRGLSLKVATFLATCLFLSPAFAQAPAHVAQEDLDARSSAATDRSTFDMTATVDTTGNALVGFFCGRHSADYTYTVVRDPGGADEAFTCVHASRQDAGNSQFYVTAVCTLNGVASGAQTVRATMSATTLGGDTGILHEYSGVDAIGANNPTTAANSATITNSVTTTRADSKVVGGFCQKGATEQGTPYTPTSGTERNDGAPGTSIGNDPSYWVADIDVASSGGTGTLTASSSTTDDYSGVVIELQSPAAAASDNRKRTIGGGMF